MLITGLRRCGPRLRHGGRFCVTSARHLHPQDRRGHRPLVVIAVHAVGLAALTSTGVISPEVNDGPLVIVGGLLADLGIVLYGGCLRHLVPLR